MKKLFVVLLLASQPLHGQDTLAVAATDTLKQDSVVSVKVDSIWHFICPPVRMSDYTYPVSWSTSVWTVSGVKKKTAPEDTLAAVDSLPKVVEVPFPAINTVKPAPKMVKAAGPGVSIGIWLAVAAIAAGGVLFRIKKRKTVSRDKP